VKPALQGGVPRRGPPVGAGTTRIVSSAGLAAARANGAFPGGAPATVGWPGLKSCRGGGETAPLYIHPGLGSLQEETPWHPRGADLVRAVHRGELHRASPGQHTGRKRGRSDRRRGAAPGLVRRGAPAECLQTRLFPGSLTRSSARRGTRALLTPPSVRSRDAAAPAAPRGDRRTRQLCFVQRHDAVADHFRGTTHEYGRAVPST